MRTVVAGLLLVALLAPLAEGQDDGPAVVRVIVDGVVTQGTTLHVEGGLARAEELGVPLLIQLDTPGGLVDATLDLDRALAGAKVPVLTYVGPQGGSFAASAGTLILLMGQPSGMADGATIGSAQPITQDGSPAGDKVENFLVGRIREIAERTGRDADIAEQFITDNRNMDADEATATGMVDVIAPDAAAFLVGVDGMTARVGIGSVTLETAGARIIDHQPGALSRVVDILGNPQVAFVLVLAGTYGVIFGLANPGSYVPEVLGALILLLGFIGLGLFTTSTAGFLLLLLALLFFVVEVFTPTHGILTGAGIVAMVFAVIFLVREPLLPESTLRQFLVVGLVLTAAIGGGTMAAVTVALKARKRPVHDTIIGAHAEAIEAIEPDGRVMLNGEVWIARSDGQDIPDGARVEVIGRQGLTVIVAPLDEEE